MEHQIAVSLVQLADLDILFSSSHSMQPGPSSQIPGSLPQAGTYYLRPGADTLWLTLSVHSSFLQQPSERSSDG